MKYTFIILLSLFIASQAYSQTATEVIVDGKLFNDENNYPIYLYKEKFYKCRFKIDILTCYKIKDKGIRIDLGTTHEDDIWISIDDATATEIILYGKLLRETNRNKIYLYKDELYDCDFTGYPEERLYCDKIKDGGIRVP